MDFLDAFGDLRSSDVGRHVRFPCFVIVTRCPHLYAVSYDFSVGKDTKL